MADDGWLGMCIDEEYGGAGLGVTEAALMMQTIAESGGGMSAASSVHINLFGLNPVAVFGSEEQRKRMLPPIARGEVKACFGVTEPNTGLNTTQLKLRAVKKGDRYVVDGQKVWISTAQVADKILLLARTTPLEEVAKPTHGLSLFYTDFDRSRITVHEIEKMGRKCVDSNELFFAGFEIPASDLIGEEGRGFEYILHGMNPERVLIAAEAVGIGRLALLARRRLREGARRLRPADRPEPGDPASARAELDGARGGQPGRLAGGVAVRQRHELRRRGQRRQVPRRRGRLQRLPAGGDDARRHSATRRSTTSSATCAR